MTDYIPYRSEIIENTGRTVGKSGDFIYCIVTVVSSTVCMFKFMIWTSRRCISVLRGQLTKNTRSKDKNICTLNNENINIQYAHS